MGGFAVIVDWDSPVEPGEVDRMMDLIPHRATGGIRTHVTPHAVLAEGRTIHQVDDQPWAVATLGPLAMVGDIRLFDTGRLRAAAGGDTATRGLDDRRLLLAAYMRKGIDFLDAVDGDFAFVIWDDAEQRILAVRDRFAVKSIFHDEASTGIRFASEVKQLVAASPMARRPDPQTVAEFVAYDLQSADRTFLEGICRIPPAAALRATRAAIALHTYWAIPSTVRYEEPSTLPYLFREHLVAAVERRLRTSRRAVSQLSGGLDSSAIAASAAMLVTRGRSAELVTLSAVYSDPSIDESRWIDDIVARQPFEHSAFAPRPPTIADFDADMRLADGPLIELIRDLNHETARLARDRGADLALSGDGGDEVTYQGMYLADLIRSSSPLRFGRDVALTSRARGISLGATGLMPLRQLAPPTLRATARALRKAVTRHGLPDADELTVARRMHQIPRSRSLPPSSLTAGAIFDGLTAPVSAWIHELQSNVFSRYGVDVSYPFFDRDLAEFVLSIDPLDLPFDGRSKVLLRRGFSGDLPESVLGRSTKTLAGQYLDDVLEPSRREFRLRWPRVPDVADELIAQDPYREFVERYDRGLLSDIDRLMLMRIWLVFGWLEGSPARHRSAA